MSFEEYLSDVMGYSWDEYMEFSTEQEWSLEKEYEEYMYKNWCE